MTPAELTGRALEYYRRWRELGLSEAAALAEVDRSGIALEESLYESFRSLGLSERAARIAAQGREGGAPPADPFDAAVQRYQDMGLSEGAARYAAIGRGMTEAEARRAYAEAAGHSRSTPLQESAEVDRVFAEAVRVMCARTGIDDAAARQVLTRNLAGFDQAARLRHLREYLRRYGTGAAPSGGTRTPAREAMPRARPVTLSETTWEGWR
jgi:hypothetical protein